MKTWPMPIPRGVSHCPDPWIDPAKKAFHDAPLQSGSWSNRVLFVHAALPARQEKRLPRTLVTSAKADSGMRKIGCNDSWPCGSGNKCNIARVSESGRVLPVNSHPPIHAFIPHPVSTCTPSASSRTNVRLHQCQLRGLFSTAC